jgi:hypothetical protein
VDDPAGREAAGGRRHGLSDWQAPAVPAGSQSATLVQDRGPTLRWIAPSTPPPPSSDEFAALTIASTRSAVTSPVTSSIVAGRPGWQHATSGVVFREVPGGTFWMGLSDAELDAVRAIERGGGVEDSVEPFFASAGNARPVRQVRVSRS